MARRTGRPKPKIGKAHSVLSYRLKVHGTDNLKKYIEQRIKLV